MKARMRTVYTMRSGEAEWTGDCPRWADTNRRLGFVVTETRVRWFGDPWTCPTCNSGSH